MSSPIPIPYTSYELYVPVHKRNRSTASSYSSTRSPSPLSSRGPSPTPHNGVYTPAELISLAHSPLVHASGGDMDIRLRAVAPEVVQTRKQRKALEWHARLAPTPAETTGSHRRGRPSRGHASESEEDNLTSWRRM